MKSFFSALVRFASSIWKFIRNVNWENIFLLLLIVVSPFLMYYNLELNPRTWHDEGASLAIPKTLVEDGVYAVRSSDGYQTFGPVQSVGPTVTLPIAWVFQNFGVGLLQGRLVSATYALITLWIFFFCAWYLFSKRVALLAVAFMLSSPSAGYLLNGRQVLGEAPAIGFFLAGWLAWAVGVNKNRKWLYVLSGVFIGLAMITKSQYMILAMGTLGLLVVLDFFYFRQKIYGWIILTGTVAVACLAGWYIWQINYFGMDVFRENAAKMGVLAKSTVGFNLHSMIEAIRFLLGNGSAHFYFFWSWPALLYTAFLSLRRDKQGVVLSFLSLFTILWILYFSLWIIPWFRYFFPAGVLTSIFVAKLFFDLADGLKASGQGVWDEIRQIDLKSSFALSSRSVLYLGTVVSLLVMTLGLVYQLQQVIRSDVLDTNGADEILNSSPPQFYAPQEIADYLNQNIENGKVIETWERELGVLTDHTYHFPDQVMLAQVHLRLYRGGNNVYGLSDDYFQQVKPDYIVIGWYSRLNNIYDLDAVERLSEKVASFGEGEWRYDVYKMARP